MARAKSVATNGNTYEEARKLRVEENKKRIEDLGILNLAKKLSEPARSEKKSKVQQRLPKPENCEPFELRRSSRARNPVSYRDDIDIGISNLRKRRSNLSSWDRSLDEIKFATYEEQERTKKAAEKFQSSLQSEKPSFVKQMLQSHVYQGFWLGLPAPFCKNHLPKEDVEVILEDENGSESGSKFLGEKAGLSAGWRGFALAHKLNAGDALVFELVKQWKFKVYTFRATASHPSEKCLDNVDREGSAGLENRSKGGKKLRLNSVGAQKEKKDTQIQKEAKANADENAGLINIQKPKGRKGIINGGTSDEVENDKKDKSAGSEKPKFEDKDQCVAKPGKKRAEGLFRKRVRV